MVFRTSIRYAYFVMVTCLLAGLAVWGNVVSVTSLVSLGAEEIAAEIVQAIPFVGNSIVMALDGVRIPAETIGSSFLEKTTFFFMLVIMNHGIRLFDRWVYSWLQVLAPEPGGIFRYAEQGMIAVIYLVTSVLNALIGTRVFLYYLQEKPYLWVILLIVVGLAVLTIKLETAYHTVISFILSVLDIIAVYLTALCIYNLGNLNETVAMTSAVCLCGCILYLTFAFASSISGIRKT